MNEVLRDPMPSVDRVLGAGTRRIGMERLVAAVVAAACLALLLVAAWLEPSPTGVGTHTQIVPLRSCAWIEVAGLPCPTCGMTTAFAHAADGRFLQSFLAQPMGFALAMLTAMTFWVSLYITLTGSPIARVFARMWRPSVVWIGAALILASWGYKIWAMKQGGDL